MIISSYYEFGREKSVQNHCLGYFLFQQSNTTHFILLSGLYEDGYICVFVDNEW